jgi:hypothetical protein
LDWQTVTKYTPCPHQPRHTAIAVHEWVNLNKSPDQAAEDFRKKKGAITRRVALPTQLELSQLERRCAEKSKHMFIDDCEIAAWQAPYLNVYA